MWYPNLKLRDTLTADPSSNLALRNSNTHCAKEKMPWGQSDLQTFFAVTVHGRATIFRTFKMWLLTLFKVRTPQHDVDSVCCHHLPWFPGDAP